MRHAQASSNFRTMVEDTCHIAWQADTQGSVTFINDAFFAYTFRLTEITLHLTEGEKRMRTVFERMAIFHVQDPAVFIRDEVFCSMGNKSIADDIAIFILRIADVSTVPTLLGSHNKTHA